ncbi:MAG: SDR family oxidoreductase [Thiogranum sp.]|nr:SDR family oxidoreductase [Thiogranum sp.]
MTQPPQHQERQPGCEHQMEPRPEVIRDDYRGSDKLAGKVAIITGGDSGIGRAVAVHFAREGADVMIAYLEEDRDAEETCAMVQREGRRCERFRGDLGDAEHCRELVAQTIKSLQRLDIVVNNGAEQHDVDTLEDITPEHWDRTFRTNIHAYFYLTRAALPEMQAGSSIINTTSVNAYKGNSHLIAYTATKGAIVAFTRSIALSLAEREIRANGVAPGPVWTPLIPSTFPAEATGNFGSQVPLKRPGQPSEIAPSYVFIASQDASYMTGQILHPNGGYIVNA